MRVKRHKPTETSQTLMVLSLDPLTRKGPALPELRLFCESIFSLFPTSDERKLTSLPAASQTEAKADSGAQAIHSTV